ncbi:hypothetical protein EJ063_01435 [Vibrio aquaticus]|uniref:Uncharacterized protein n=2 Tax=Vibrio aquaticus TaxID=2496559 RepID=A0A3S0Q382_9VIBR|nr:hypothetical protein EJ063_01435 [Vibrio aquaticus]
MVSITQRDNLEATARTLSNAINNINHPKDKTTPAPSQEIANRLAREAKTVFEVIGYIGANDGLESLYKALSDGENACRTIQHLPKLPPDILTAINSIRRDLRSGLNELNVYVNLQQFQNKEESRSYFDKSKTELEQLITSVRSEAEKYLDYKHDIQKLIIDAQSEQQTINKLVTDYRKNIENFSEQSLSNISHRADMIKDTLQDYGSRTQSELAQASDNIIQELESRSNTVGQETIERIRTQSAERTKTFNDVVDSQINSISERIDSEVKEFETKKTEITEILGEISTAYQAGANSRQADKEESAANKYRIAGIIGLVATIFCSIWLFNDYIQFFGKPEGTITPIDELGIGWFALRFMTITLLTTPSIYMLKESAAHRSKENVYRQRSTHLSSIGAYTDELSAPEKAQLKKELAANFFSLYDGKPDTSNVPDFIKNMNEAIKMAQAIKTPRDQSSSSSKTETTPKP